MRSILLGLALLTPMLAGPAPGTGPPHETDATAAPKTEPAPLDPVVAAVVRMLGEGVASETIAMWLDRSGASPGTTTPDDLIALTRAGASDGSGSASRMP